jgi:hypothetical protein
MGITDADDAEMTVSVCMRMTTRTRLAAASPVCGAIKREGKRCTADPPHHAPYQSGSDPHTYQARGSVLHGRTAAVVSCFHAAQESPDGSVSPAEAALSGELMNEMKQAKTSGNWLKSAETVHAASEMAAQVQERFLSSPGVA